MGFSMKDVKRKVSNKQEDIKSCYAYIKNRDILTENVKTALWKYCDYRFKSRNRGTLNAESLGMMIDELLEFVCNKPIISIGIYDVNKEECEIIYQLKRAMFFGATRTLYYDNSDQILESIKGVIHKIEKPRQNITSQELLKYLEDIEV